jgi:hypothetical protein
MRKIALAAAALAVVGAASCAGERLPNAGASRAGSRPSTSPTVAPTTPVPDPPRFSSDVAAIDASTRQRMSASWRPGCPVPLADLRLLRLSYWGFDGSAHSGELVVHADVADDVVGVFRRLFDARFPIRRMRLIDEYGADDGRSMAANNTSAFNCRRSTGDPSVWSEHAYGRAIDINPVQNPYVSSSGAVDPAAGAAYVGRPAGARGLIEAEGVVVKAFRSIGWGWGGDWTRSKDYQHFSRSGL